MKMELSNKKREFKDSNGNLFQEGFYEYTRTETDSGNIGRAIGYLYKSDDLNAWLIDYGFAVYGVSEHFSKYYVPVKLCEVINEQIMAEQKADGLKHLLNGELNGNNHGGELARMKDYIENNKDCWEWNYWVSERRQKSK